MRSDPKSPHSDDFACASLVFLSKSLAVEALKVNTKLRQGPKLTHSDNLFEVKDRYLEVDYHNFRLFDDEFMNESAIVNMHQ